MRSAPAAHASRAAPLLLIDLDTEQGVTGRSYLFCYLPAAAPAIAASLAEVASVVKGDAVAPLDLWAQARRALCPDRRAGHRPHGDGRIGCRVLGCARDRRGTAARAPDRRGTAADPALQQLWARPDGAEEVADEAEKLLAGGFRAVKLRLGYPTLQQDLAAVRAVRKRVGDGIALMVDYNQALTVAQALERGRVLDAEDVAWLEEPIRHDDYAGVRG